MSRTDWSRCCHECSTAPWCRKFELCMNCTWPENHPEIQVVEPVVRVIHEVGCNVYPQGAGSATSGAPRVIHGINCPKVEHSPHGAYAHAPEYDGTYGPVGDLVSCGRCHAVLQRVGLTSVAPKPRVIHGVDCPKWVHAPGCDYGHAPDSDNPYIICGDNGIVCGRCHQRIEVLPRVADKAEDTIKGLHETLQDRVDKLIDARQQLHDQARQLDAAQTRIIALDGSLKDTLAQRDMKTHELNLQSQRLDAAQRRVHQLNRDLTLRSNELSITRAEFIRVSELQKMPIPSRLMALARETSREQHNRCADSEGYGAMSGHSLRHQECPHPDCAIVRYGPVTPEERAPEPTCTKSHNGWAETVECPVHRREILAELHLTAAKLTRLHLEHDKATTYIAELRAALETISAAAGEVI